MSRGADWLQIGPSSLRWSGDALTIHLDERAAWSPARIRGTVTVRPEALTGAQFLLDDSGRHRWSPLAPRSRVTVALQHPEVHWEGDGYFDTNDGDAPLEQDFAQWHWSCARLRKGAAILYDVMPRAGTQRCLALQVASDGAVLQTEPPPEQQLRRTRWGIARTTHTHGTASVTRTLLDAPFYARSVIATEMGGETAIAMHESLDMNRFSSPWVQAMLPFRVPRSLA